MSARLKTSLLVVAASLPSVQSHNGYEFHSTGPANMAGTKVALLDPNNSEIQKLADGFTSFSWIKFDDVTTAPQPPFMMNNVRLPLSAPDARAPRLTHPFPALAAPRVEFL